MIQLRTIGRSWSRVALPAAFLALLVIQAAPVLAQTPAPESSAYVVQPGDTLSEIARRYGLTVEAIAAANDIADPRLVVVGQRLLIPAGSSEPAATPTPHIYVVQPGDTLGAIAQRFGTTIAALAAANSISDPGLVLAGQKLVIPVATQEPTTELPQPGVFYRMHRVRGGETLPFLAFRYGTTLWDMRLENALGIMDLLFPGQELEIPSPSAPTAATPRFPAIDASPSPIAQGQTILIQVEGGDQLELSGLLLDQGLEFGTRTGRYWALAGVDALTEPGSHLLALTAVELRTGDLLSMTVPFNVTAGSFTRINVAVPEERQALLDPELSRAEQAKLDQVFAQSAENQQWDGVFAYPLAGELVLTAGFGQRRTYAGGSGSSYHTGRDYDAATGAPVYAPASGTVVLAEPLKVRGNAVIIDHGLGVFTGFWHLSEFEVAPGQVVQQGDAIGQVGDTGLSTGPHLHWEMRVHGVPVDPIQWTQRAFP